MSAPSDRGVCAQCQLPPDGTEQPSAYNDIWLHPKCTDKFVHAKMIEQGVPWHDPNSAGRLAWSAPTLTEVLGREKERTLSALAAPLTGQVPFTGLPNGIAAIEELKDHPRWVAWRYAWRGGPKFTKPPINAHTGHLASTSDPRTWATYEQALACAIERGLPGVGYVLGEGDGDLTGIDLDGCVDSTTGKIIDPEIDAIVSFAGSYTEISPSGTGLRIFARGKVETALKNVAAGVEIYGGGRYLTITGRCISICKEICETAHTITALRARVERVIQATAGQPTPEDGAEKAPPRKRTGMLWDAIFGQAERSGDDFFRKVNTAALVHREAWVPTLFPGAFRNSAGQWRVPSAALGRDLQEDISIAPSGIKDFGVHDLNDPREGKRTPIDLTLQYSTEETVADSALWLCQRMGIDPASLGWKSEGAGQGQEQASARRSNMHYFDDCETVTAKLWILKGLIARGEISSWIAPPGKGKSGLLTAIMIYAAAGRDFRQFPSKGPCGVLYLAFERSAHTKRRLTAYHQKGFKHLPIVIRTGVINLMDIGCVKIIADAMKEAEAHLGVPIGLVIFDTFAKGVASGGGDENTAKDQGRCLSHLQMLRDDTGCHTAVIHHTGKDLAKGARGSSAQPADVDAEFMISDGGDKVRVVGVTKANDQPEGEYLRFTIVSKTVGQDEDGDDITVGILADDDEQQPGIQQAREWPVRLRPLQEAINEAIINAGFDHHIPRGPTVKAVSLDEVKAIYRQKVVSVTPDPNRPYRKADDSLEYDIKRASQLFLVGTTNVGRKGIIWTA
jgi:AAA domain